MSDQLDAPPASAADPPAEHDFIPFATMIHRLAARFPSVPIARIEAIAHEENDVITGGALQVVPRLVEIGTLERLEAYSSAISSSD